jgi:hypothetical protein
MGPRTRRCVSAIASDPSTLLSADRFGGEPPTITRSTGRVAPAQVRRPRHNPGHATADRATIPSANRSHASLTTGASEPCSPSRRYQRFEANRLLTAETVGSETALFLDRDQSPQLPTPIPAGVTPREVEDLRWITDIHVRDWTAMRHPALGGGPLVADGGDSRLTADGVAYSCPKWVVMRAVPLMQQVRRPNLSPLPLLDQLRIAAAAGGWECQLSHKGQFTLSACDLFGDFEDLCAALRDPDVAMLLMGYVDADREAPGRLLDRRRYLRLGDVGALGLTGDTAALVNRLQWLSVLVRGLVLKCSRCRYAAFYRARDTDPTFTCLRCSHQQRPAREQWLDTAEPEWHYRLDEAVFQFLRQRGDLPVLVAHDLFAGSREAVLVVPEIEFQETGSHANPRELDFAVLRGASLYLGEAFTAARYEQSRGDENRRLNSA